MKSNYLIKEIQDGKIKEGTYTGDKIEIIKDRVNELIRHINEGIQETEFPF